MNNFWDRVLDENEETVYPLNSTALLAAKVRGNNSVSIVFLDGREYRYDHVDSTIIDGLLTATSAGKYYNQNIRDKFTVERI